MLPREIGSPHGKTQSFGRRDISIHYIHDYKIATDVRVKTLLSNALKISETLQHVKNKSLLNSQVFCFILAVFYLKQ